MLFGCQCHNIFLQLKSETLRHQRITRSAAATVRKGCSSNSAFLCLLPFVFWWWFPMINCTYCISQGAQHVAVCRMTVSLKLLMLLTMENHFGRRVECLASEKVRGGCERLTDHSLRKHSPGGDCVFCFINTSGLCLFVSHVIYISRKKKIK